MKNQFVTYEIALKLKELGFDEKCFGVYYDYKGNYKLCFDSLFSNKDIIIHTDEHSYCTLCLAPLWQQVIDWFREKHNLLIDSPKLDEWNTGKWSVKLESLDKKIILEEHVGQPYWRIYRGFDSYEKAKEQVILKAIELC